MGLVFSKKIDGICQTVDQKRPNPTMKPNRPQATVVCKLHETIFRILPAIVGCLALFLFFPGKPEAGVAVFDRITTVNRAVFLKFQTTAWMFPEGGRKITIQLNGGTPQVLLSGADGYAYCKVAPGKAGLIKIAASSGAQNATGALLVLNPQQSVILIEAEAGLPKPFLTDVEKTASKTIIGLLKQHRPLVYTYRWMPAGIVRRQLEKLQYPESVIIRWKGAVTVDEMQEKGILIFAAIGSEAMLRDIPPGVKHRLSFEDTDYGERVTDWNEIPGILGIRKN